MDLTLSINTMKKVVGSLTDGRKAVYSNKELQSLRHAVEILTIIKNEEEKVEYENSGHAGRFFNGEG